MIPVVKAVPNFSEGRDPEFVVAVSRAFADEGCEVLHATSDPDHNRSVVTVIGSPRAVEEGAVNAAEIALRCIDLRFHQGVHPRVGALDVLPFVPIRGLEMEEVTDLARRTGVRIAGMGIPVYWYGHASPKGRKLASIRRGGFEALVRSLPSHRPTADLPGLDATGAPVHAFAHPSAGAACVGSRSVLLAWNVDLEGVSLRAARGIAARIREAGGGFSGLRALAFRLPVQARIQVSMSLENLVATDPLEVFRSIEDEVSRLNGRVTGTEVIGMIPEVLAASAVARTVGIGDWSEKRILSRRVSAYLASIQPGTGRNEG